MKDTYELRAHDVLYALADRVFSWSRDQEQTADTVVLAHARLFGWKPWHERERGTDLSGTVRPGGDGETDG